MTLEAEDQALVDEYLASGGEVQQIPRGKGQVEYVWNESTKQLIAIDPHQRGWGSLNYRKEKVRRQKAKKKREVRKGDRPTLAESRARFMQEAAARREITRAAFSPEKTTYQLAKETGFSRTAVADHLRILGLKTASMSKGHRA